MFDGMLWPDGFDLLAHTPPEAGTDTPALVCVHGISRNSQEHLAVFGAAAQHRIAVITPHFARDSFPNYQRLGLGKDELRADIVLDAALERLGHSRGLELRRFHLFGFSGGAQFAHRYAMMFPERVRSLHLAAAGWYTFPDPGVPWPRGMASAAHSGQIIDNLERFLTLPIRLYVGEHDTEREPGLRRSAHLDAQQGLNRLERAERWAAAVGSLRGGAKLSPPVEILKDTGHEFLQACAPSAGDLARRVVRHCLEE